MPIKIITSMETLFRLARELGQARLRGNPEEIARAEASHKAYETLVLESDEIIGFPGLGLPGHERKIS